MASFKTLAHRLFRNSGIRRTGIATSAALDPGDRRRFLHPIRPINNFHPPAPAPVVGLGNLMEKMMPRERLLLDGLVAPAPAPGAISVEETRKLVRLVEVVRLKAKLKEISSSRSWITYQEFVRICGEDCSDDENNYGVELAKRLDDSGAVIVLGNLVFLHPEQMAKAIGGLIMARAGGRSSREELEEMEKEKAAIDKKAREEVRRELWWGLGLLVGQTAALMRLTFWDLTWDVMEPICYFLTSTYFVGGYAFFLTTSKEPSFQALYHTRFLAKQSRLINHRNFDLLKYNRLRSLNNNNNNNNNANAN